ncbi:MAG: tyrosine-type recombinase/integrase [Saprospiraceae bacterium]|nr:tyrosine-type recombinase/integrase [Saprospiraceae bacterium]
MQTASFFDYLKFEKRYSPHTLEAYKSDLEQFEEFVLDTYEINEVSNIEAMHIRAWMVHLIDQQITPRSINRKLSTLKTFFKYQLKRKAIAGNPMAKIQPPKSGKRLPVFVSRPNMERLFEDFIYPEGFEGVRDRLVLETFYTLGVRVSELVNMKINDFDWAARQVKILGKGSKERLVPFAGRFEQSVESYLLKRKEIFPEIDEPNLFLNDKGKSVNSGFIYRLVNRYLSMVTTIEKKSPHVLRHSFATHLSDSGADLNAIKELLGHSSLAATQVYTHNSIEKLRRVYEQAHPKAGKGPAEN